MNLLPKMIREAAEPLTGSLRDYDPLLDLVGEVKTHSPHLRHDFGVADS